MSIRRLVSSEVTPSFPSLPSHGPLQFVFLHAFLLSSLSKDTHHIGLGHKLTIYLNHHLQTLSPNKVTPWHLRVYGPTHKLGEWDTIQSVIRPFIKSVEVTTQIPSTFQTRPVSPLMKAFFSMIEMFLLIECPKWLIIYFRIRIQVHGLPPFPNTKTLASVHLSRELPSFCCISLSSLPLIFSS